MDMKAESAALAALLAAQSSAVAQLSSPRRPPKRAHNPNRAREEQRRELLALREQAPRLEQALARLQWRARRRQRQLTGVRGAGEAWREVARCKKELSEQAQRENAQLRAVVQRQIEIGRTMRRMLQAQLRWESVRDSGQPCVVRTETAIFERLLAGVARSFAEVDAVFVAYGGADSAFPCQADEDAAPMEVTARRVDAVTSAASNQRRAMTWRYFARPIEYMPWRASMEPEHPNLEAKSDPTVVESCGVKLYAAGSDDAGHVCQFVCKSKENERIEITWGSFPDTSLKTLFGGHVSHPRTQRSSFRCPHSDRSFLQHLASSTSDLDAVLQPNSAWGQLTAHCDSESDYHDTCAESLEVTARKIMPFDVRATGDTAWQYFGHALEHVNFRFYYKKDDQNLNVSDNTIVEGFQLELAPNGRKRARSRVHQVLRKYEGSEGRVVIVWRAAMQVVEFGGKPLHGVCYHEKGYVEIRQANAGSMDGALVQTCYLITPRWEDPCVLTAQDRKELTNTVLSSTAANVTASYQMIESALLDEAVRSLQMWA